MKCVVVLVLVCSCFMASPVVRFGSGKSAQESQHDTITELMPPLLATDRKWSGEVRVQKIRVWADDEYRAQNVHWERAFGEELAYANEVLAPLVGIRLEAEYRTWDHHAPGFTLAEHLAELAKLDPGEDVLSVIGLTSSLSLVSASFEQLGFASTPGNHLVLRGYAEVGERQAFDRAFPKVSADERDAVVEARRRHKTAALLLHELGHNFGAPHVDEADTIMNATYSHHAAAFDDRSRALMLATLARRLGRASPGLASSAPIARHASLVVTIVLSGEVQVDGKPVDDAALDALFRSSFAQDHDAELIVKVARKAPRGPMIQVIDRAKAIGLHRVTMGPADAP